MYSLYLENDKIFLHNQLRNPLLQLSLPNFYTSLFSLYHVFQTLMSCFGGLMKIKVYFINLTGILLLIFRQNLEQSGTSFDSFSERQGPRMYDGGARKIQVQFVQNRFWYKSISDKPIVGQFH